MSKTSDGNTVLVSMLGLGIAMVLARGWLNAADNFVKSKVHGANASPTANSAAPPTSGGSGSSGFAGGSSGSGVGGGGGGSW